MAWALAPVPLAGQESSLEGRMLDAATTTPVVGATVGVAILSSVRATTDEDGSFHLTGLAPGRLELLVQRSGYLSARRVLLLSGGTRTG